MIITRTPFRITLGGGGTDLPSYYERYGGFLISAAIDRYMYITVNKRFEGNLRISYSKTEIVEDADMVQHPVVREALKLLGIRSGLEITSIAELPAQSGLGSSGCFVVGLLRALHAYKREFPSSQEIAEEAFHIEAEILQEPVGKQDQYITAFGDIICMDIHKNGHVDVEVLDLDENAMDQMESNNLFFYTGLQRKASDILAEQNTAAKKNEQLVVDSMHQIKEIGRQCREWLLSGDIQSFGQSLHHHWQLKKQISDKMSHCNIDRWYELARENGALGGKIMGAGGGGFFMFYCDNGKQKLREVLKREGLREFRFKIDHEGSKVVVNLG
jgi:D-glycero-alpha-D-manno-heptose-7-phosphate kinase